MILRALVGLAVIGTSLWVFFDAMDADARAGMTRKPGDMGPVGWLIFCLLLWIIAFPLYLAARRRRRSTAPGPRADS